MEERYRDYIRLQLQDIKRVIFETTKSTDPNSEPFLQELLNKFKLYKKINNQLNKYTNSNSDT